MNKLLLILMIVIGGFSSSAGASASYTMVKCDYCGSSSSFKAAAEALGTGSYVVVNTNTYIAEWYQVVEENAETVTIKSPLPAEVNEAIQQYKDLLQAFEDYAAKTQSQVLQE